MIELGIAIAALQVTLGKTHKYLFLAEINPFALDALKYFCNLSCHTVIPHTIVYRLSSIVYRLSSIVYRLSSIVHRPSSLVNLLTTFYLLLSTPEYRVLDTCFAKSFFPKPTALALA